ncbi:MAG: ROK family protein [Lentisphaeria bacterium]|jgi:glucokinase|nr:ROK family protein [Lentisphaeria bacterium]
MTLQSLSGGEPARLGFDVGGSKCAVCLGTAGGEILARREWPSRAERGPEPMIRELVEAARGLLAGGGVAGAGVSIGGPVDADRGVVYEPPNLPGWRAIPLRERLEAEFGVPVNVEHDAAACALAEYLWGVERGPRRLVYLTCATGFGAGMVFDGKPYYGANGRSPEIGHMRLAEDGPSAFGVAGSAEAFCSARSLGRIAAWRFPARWPAEPTPKEIEDLWRAGDAEAKEVIECNAKMVGRCCAFLGDLLHPDHITLGSLARYLGEPWLELVRAEFAGGVLPDVAADCRIEGTRLGTRLQDLSALAAAFLV